MQQLLAHIDASILYAKQLHQSTTSDQYVLYDVVRELQLRRFYWAAKLIKAFETINSKGEKLVIDKNQIFQTILTQTLSEIVGHLSPLNSQTAECLKSIKHLYQDLLRNGKSPSFDYAN
ncbi:MAG: hypothetical protein HWD59_02425 [Coxiellaceae bacterium]|nr:MAG: hypothetical protein HWD59_02425 [Coxiellaceae bacterium]